ncbi:DinB superfamily protein [Bryocella elongata]|uniref:DinB superfamily protein n=1 Tax=Bryocella elongata TaxID=863522 RepID=A0A1H5UIQ9_9BACT|nr:DinB family protein [Bryocella elongata]SEF74924.1 DinB superfamily protein [Bryocella elongata]
MSQTSASPSGNSLGSSLRKELAALLDGGLAHASFAQAVKDFPVELRGTVPQGLPYSAWQIVEHIRVAQKDMLEYSDNADGSYKPMKWPADYWPKDAAPTSDTAWDETIAAIYADRKTFDDLLDSASDDELVTPFPWGTGQTLLREALQIADHNAYHVGELIVVRRMLGAWK